MVGVALMQTVNQQEGQTQGHMWITVTTPLPSALTVGVSDIRAVKQIL